MRRAKRDFIDWIEINSYLEFHRQTYYWCELQARAFLMLARASSSCTQIKANKTNYNPKKVVICCFINIYI